MQQRDWNQMMTQLTNVVAQLMILGMIGRMMGSLVGSLTGAISPVPSPILLPQVHGLVSVYDIRTGELKKILSPRGKPLAVVEDGRLILTPLGKRLGYEVVGLGLKKKGMSPVFEQEEARFIGECEIVKGLCLTHGYSVSKTVKCPESPFTDEEWAAAWELVEEAFPQGMSNPWVNGWWPRTREEAEKAAQEYKRKMEAALDTLTRRERQAIENYRTAAHKSIELYRAYVIGEYERGRELALVR